MEHLNLFDNMLQHDAILEADWRWQHTTDMRCGCLNMEGVIGIYRHMIFADGNGDGDANG